MKKSVGVIGTGAIAVPLVRSLLRRFPDLNVVVSPRSRSVSAALAAESSQVSVAKDNQTVLDSSDTILLCLLERVARNVLPKLDFRPEHRLISVMVDYTVEDLRDDCSPASQIELTVPLPFIETGNCPLACYPSADIVSEWFGGDNQILVFETSEAMLPHIAVAGVVASFIFGVETVSQWLGAKTGRPHDAEAYVLSMLSGYLQVTKRDGQARLQEALQKLSTKGGLNAELLEAMQDSGHYNHLQRGLDELMKRLTF